MTLDSLFDVERSKALFILFLSDFGSRLESVWLFVLACANRFVGIAMVDWGRYRDSAGIR